MISHAFSSKVGDLLVSASDPSSLAFTEILTQDALRFLSALHQRFHEPRQALLARRVQRQGELDAGKWPAFLPETQHIREREWTVAPLPDDLLDRRVEITGPVDRKMVINGLNSGANVFMADFEDSNAPTWRNCMEGQVNLRDAVNGSITYTHPTRNKLYQLNPQTATLMVRPRGWHLDEKHLLMDGQPLSASLVDFGLFFFHNAHALIAKGSGPYFYLPKLESHLEARLWNEVFVFAQDYLGIPQGTIKATVLVETILASFELHEILWELKAHSAGLNCGRWDYIFSFIKKFCRHPECLLPDRAQVGMTTPFMEAYSQLVIQTCHRRGVHAMGGMAAQIPIKGDPEANQKALEKVRQDKLREVKAGHDGTWVAHPALVEIAREVFDTHMPQPHQIDRKLAELDISAADLLAVPEGSITEAGIRLNIRVGILYLQSWLMGQGCVALYHLMEDAATAEISRAQLWQWLQHRAILEDGRPFTLPLYEHFLTEEIRSLRLQVDQEGGGPHRLTEACTLFDQLVRKQSFVAFLTLPAYPHL